MIKDSQSSLKGKPWKELELTYDHCKEVFPFSVPKFRFAAHEILTVICFAPNSILFQELD